MKLTKKKLMHFAIFTTSVLIILIIKFNSIQILDINIDEAKLIQQRSASDPFPIGILPLKAISVDKQVLLVNSNTNEFYLLDKLNYKLIKKYPIAFIFGDYKIVDAAYHENKIYLLLNKFSGTSIQLATELIVFDAHDQFNINNPMTFDIIVEKNAKASQHQPSTVNFLPSGFNANQIEYINIIDSNKVNPAEQILLGYVFPLDHLDQIGLILNRINNGNDTPDDDKYLGVIKNLKVFEHEMYLQDYSNSGKKVSFKIFNSTPEMNITIDSQIIYNQILFPSIYPLINNDTNLVVVGSKNMVDKLILQKVNKNSNVVNTIEVEKSKLLGIANIDNNLVYFLLNTEGKVTVNSI